VIGLEDDSQTPRRRARRQWDGAQADRPAGVVHPGPAPRRKSEVRL